jgi:hypothetical protein
MAGDTGNPAASNVVVADRTNIITTTKKIETVANMYAGVAVMKGTNDDDIVVSDGTQGTVQGWLGYEDTPKKYRPATISTIYTVNDKVAQVNGPGIKVRAFLLSGQTVTEGTHLMVAAAGHLSGATIGTHGVIAIAAESKASTAALTVIMVRSLI